ncbi:serine/threonine protein kinase [Nocardia uniformis]|uniref:Serine/threonine protein kinase n=1 Tax=Nocardia uniformis TaxID=53432 RepID=A0A849BZG6_9NOCA|nr:serine/threonine-protein kinase [Nocardia uniformis]NNH71902.1 serine/threonine protein kinase [Nocardia uniformis]
MKGLGTNDPRQLGRNRMVAVIGQGGMGRVLLGQAPTGRLVAVKQIHRHLAKDSEFRARFHREVQASSQVTGAYTAAVVDSDTESDNPWLATEYIPGSALGTVVDETGPLSLGGLRLLAAGLASALIEIHRAGLIHRDLKPANVLLAADGPRVIDFGIARAMEGDAQLTATGSVVGSPAFMSPEQAMGQPLTPAADVFSVGAILTMAATGESPFAGTSTPQVLYNVIHSPPDTSRVPAPLRDIVERCLAKEPDQRPTPEQLLEAAGQLEAEPVWPGAVRDVIDEQQSASNWWAETTAKHARYESQMAGLKERRRRTVRSAAAAVGALVLLIGTAFSAHELAEQVGHATPATDLSLALTGTQWRTVDPCALLEKSLTSEFGARSGDFSDGIAGTCRADFTDSAGTKRTFEVAVAGRDVLGEYLWRPTGAVAGWLPIYGQLKDGARCQRSVITQSRPAVTVEITASEPGKQADGCPAAERGLSAVVNRLALNPPQLTLPENSIRTLDPCALLDKKLVAELAGANSYQNSHPTYCYSSGDDYYFSLTLSETGRPDKYGRGEETQLDGQTVHINDSLPDLGRCALAYMARPTRADQAEVVTISVSGWNTEVTDSCDRVERIFSAVLPQLPK